MPLSAPILVHVDQELAELIPRFLTNQQKALAAMQRAWADHDYDTLRQYGHKMKGAAGGYGFDALTDMGSAIEDAAKVRDAMHIRQSLEALGEYLDRVEVVYD